MKITSTEVKAEKIQWIPLVILAFALSIAGTCATALNGIVGSVFSCKYNWGVYSRPTYLATFSLVLPMLLSLVLYPFRSRIKASMTTMVSLYTVGLVASYSLGHYETFALIPTGFTSLLVYTPEPVRSLMQSWWWVPPYDIVHDFVTGGTVFNWSAWFPTIVFWSAYYLVFIFFSSTMMLLFRRRWIDVEKIPFPHVVAAHETIMSGTPSAPRTGMGKGRLFLIAALIGLFIQLDIMFTYLYPWWPDIFGYRTPGTASPGCFHPPATDTLMSSIVGWIGYSKDPLSFAMFYLAPLDISFTVWVVFLVMLICSQVGYALGYYTGIMELGASDRLLGTTSLFMSPPFYWSYIGTLGGTTGIVIMMMWNSRGYLAETIKAARNKASKEIEAKEPFSYRTVYIMLGISAVLVIAFLLVAGLSLLTTIVVFVVGAIINVLAQLYIFGLSGLAYVNERSGWRGYPLGIVWPTQPPAYTTDWIMSHTMFVAAMNHPGHGMLVTGMSAGQAYKMADMTGFSVRRIFYLMMAVTLVCIPTVIATRLWVVNIFGAPRLVWTGCSVSDMCGNAFAYAFAGNVPGATVASVTAQFECMAVGAIITIALFLLRGRFLWFPINPVGFVISTGISVVWWGSWDAFLIAWIAKYLTLRVGGSKAYEQQGVPVAAGLIAGLTMGDFLCYVLGIFKFFFPS
jgi:hypothetical protein